MHAPSIAIVGSGPSGCYMAQALRKAWAQAPIAIFERLPVPYGLARYGVAPDHPGTKAVTRQFERLFERENIQFFGNIEIGRDLSLDELRAAYDIVVLATGLSGDRRLGIEGDQLPGVLGAGRLTRLFNDHPDECDQAPQLGKRIIIVGNGNVSIDLLRLLTKTSAEFAGSDISEETLALLQSSDVHEIDIVGRSPAAEAKCDTAMLRELGKLSRVNFSLAADSTLGTAADTGGQARLDALRDLVSKSPYCSESIQVRFHFGWVPQTVLGTNTAAGLTLQAADGSGRHLELSADTIITAIGFEEHSEQPLQRAALSSTETNLAQGLLSQGLYCAGWFRRGPRGTIPDNRSDARLVAEEIIATVESGALHCTKDGLSQLPAKLSDYSSWQKIDHLEQQQASEHRTRRKLRSRAEMLKAACNTQGI